MEPIKHEPEVVKGVEVLSFDQVELEKIKNDSSQIFATIGSLNVLYFDYYERFILQLNNWRYALIPRLASTGSSDNEEIVNYTLPAYDGVYNIKLPRHFSSAAFRNFETILGNTTKFNRHQEPVQQSEVIVRHEEEFISSDPTGTYEQRYVSQQRLPVELSNRTGELSSSRNSNYSTSTNQTERKRDKLKRKLKGAFGKKDGSRTNSNLTEVKDFDSLRRTSETLVPVHEFKREEIETTIVSAKEIARKLEHPKGDMKTEVKEKVIGIMDRVKEGVNDFKERVAAKHAHEGDGQKIGIMTMVKEGIHDMKEILTGKGHEEITDQPASSQTLIQTSIQPSTQIDQRLEQASNNHPRERLRIFDNKYLDQPVPGPMLSQTSNLGTSVYYHQVDKTEVIAPIHGTSSGQHHSGQVIYQDITNDIPTHEGHSLTNKAKELVGSVSSVFTRHSEKPTPKDAHSTQGTEEHSNEKPSSTSSTAENKGRKSSGGGIPVTKAELVKAAMPLLMPGLANPFSQPESGVKTLVSTIFSGKREEEAIPVQSLTTHTQPPTFMDKVKGGKTIHDDPTPIQSLEMREVPIPESKGPTFMEKVKASIPVIQEKVETKIPLIKEKIMALESRIEAKVLGPKRNEIEIQTDPVDLEEVTNVSSYMPVQNVIQSEIISQKVDYQVPTGVATQSLTQNFNQGIQTVPLQSQVVAPIYEHGNIERHTPIQLQTASYTNQGNYSEVGRSSIEQTTSHVRSGKYAKHLPDTNTVSRSIAGTVPSVQRVEPIRDESITHYQA